MSVKAMGWVWDQNLPRDEKLVLLAYADHADHEGGNIYPSIETVAKKTGYSERSVQRITRKLEKKKLLIPLGGQQGGSGITPHWYMPMSKGDRLTPIEKGDKNDKVQKRVTNDAKKGDIAVSPEPSLTLNNNNITQQQAMVGVLSEVTGLDWRIKSNAGRLAKRAAELLKAGYEPAHIEHAYREGGWWYREDWRGKKGQKPKPEQVGETILQAIESMPKERKPKKRTIKLPDGTLQEVQT